jgi:peroxiredoxin
MSVHKWLLIVSTVLILAGCSSSATAPTSQPAAGGNGASTADASAETGLEPGQVAPDFSAKLVSGQTVSLKELRGRVVLINFWATWCAPCRHEMPDFQKIADRYDKKDFTVLAVNFQESPETIKKFTTNMGLKFDVALDQNGAINHLYGVNQYPVSYVIGRDGKVLVRQYGAFSSIESLQQSLQKWIAGT